ncbi:MAG: ATP-binding cassette domain-containing protein [Myxococcaceae bacterium]
MIEVTSLQKSFGTIRAVRDVSFTASDGEVTALLGPNGAGKTTTLRIIYGLVAPDGGSSRVDGRSSQSAPVEVRRRLGVLSDARGLYPRLTAREHVRYFGRLHGLEGDALERRVDVMLSELELVPLANRRVGGFSLGERMKVAIARALVHDPPNVLFDEPTHGLDVVALRALRALILRLRAQGRCVLLSSHVMQEVMAVCDRLVVISNGCTVASGTPASLLQQEATSDLEEAFVRTLARAPVLETPR